MTVVIKLMNSHGILYMGVKAGIRDHGGTPRHPLLLDVDHEMI
jgi:hypothetical protein